MRLQLGQSEFSNGCLVLEFSKQEMKDLADKIEEAGMPDDAEEQAKRELEAAAE